MTHQSPIASMGNARIDAAAERLNHAFNRVSETIERLRQESLSSGDTSSLEKENQQLVEKYQALQDVIAQTDQELEAMTTQIEALLANEDAA